MRPTLQHRKAIAEQIRRHDGPTDNRLMDAISRLDPAAVLDRIAELIEDGPR